MNVIETLKKLLRGERSGPLRNGDPQWCLVGNVVDLRLRGDGMGESRGGTKHFSPGTKVYCLPAQWGDGYEKIIVIGRHRGSKRFKTMIMKSDWITNWRAKVVYNPEVLRRIQQPTRKFPNRYWKSKEEVEMYVRSLEEWQAREAT